MRAFLLLGILSLGLSAGCSDPFAAANEADTVEAYEKYLEENPNGRFVIQAKSRLETLMLDRAKENRSIEEYDAYSERFPEGALRDRAKGEREALMFDQAKKNNTAEAWQKYLDEYPKARKERKQFATRMMKVHGYLPNLTLSPPRVEQINLAENPDGPLDGWGFEVDVTNAGDKVLSDLRLTVQYLSDDGGVAGEKEWPLVAEYWMVPAAEEQKAPFRPTQTRTWQWTTGNVPDRWNRQVHVFVSRIAEKSD